MGFIPKAYPTIPLSGHSELVIQVCIGEFICIHCSTIFLEIFLKYEEILNGSGEKPEGWKSLQKMRKCANI